MIPFGVDKEFTHLEHLRRIGAVQARLGEIWTALSANADSDDFKKWAGIAEAKNNDPIMTTEDLNDQQRMRHLKKTLDAINPLLQILGKNK
jgi:hypothetical protein